jgi:hypothetical protein
MQQGEVLQEELGRYNDEVAAQLLPLWIRNAMSNEPLIRRGRNVTELREKLTDVPAILVASGPSLDLNIDLLKEARKRAAIIACDSAYIPLLKADCTPHMVVSLDPNARNSRFFDGTITYQKHTVFVCGTTVHRDVIQSWCYPPYFFNPRVQGSEVQFFGALPYLVGNLGSLATGGNVFSAVKMLAMHWLMCRPVALVGADYCWYADRHHVDGASVQKFTGGVEETSDLFGRRAYWSDCLRIYHAWASLVLEGGTRRDLFDNAPVPIYNCTEGGMLTAVPRAPLRWFIAHMLNTDHGDIEDKLRRS